MIGTVIRSYGLTTYLTAVLDSYAWVDKIVVMNYRFNGTPPIKDDTTLLTVPFSNAKVMSGENLDQYAVLNMGVESLGDCELIFIADNDELITKEDQQKLIKGMDGSGIGTCDVIDYVDFHRRFPIRGHKPPVIVRPNVRFFDTRCYHGSAKYFPDVKMHHLGYTYTPKELEWKFDWEKKWEGNTTRDILCQTHIDYPLPNEISKLVYESNSDLLLTDGKHSENGGEYSRGYEGRGCRYRSSFCITNYP